MIFTFRFITDEEESFIMDININHDQTFEQLHDAIQEKLDYDPAQLASFFISNESWEKLQEITLLDMGVEGGKNMADSRIEDFFTAKNQHLLYEYDYLAGRLFFGNVIRTIDAASPIDLPSVSKLEGSIPPQIKRFDVNLNDEDWGNDEDEDEYGDFEDELPEDLEDYNIHEDNSI
ncbi:MAG: hypothetical protein WCX31_08750 [Salinivirgaceae bacterium]